MFGFGRKKKSGDDGSDKPSADTVTAPAETLPTDSAEAATKPGLFARLKAGLSKTRSGLTEGIANLVLGRKQIDADLLDDIETQLLTADVGVDATQGIIADLTQRVARKQLADAEALMSALREDMAAILRPCSQPLAIDTQKKPFVILMIGVNGVGKTTTIGKLARRLQDTGKSVMLAAGDTFRAAAVEQLQVWGERNAIPVIAQQQGADSASVIFDALQSAQARGIDVLIADTAGRLHTQSNLMEELKKIKRVLGKLDASAPHEVMLVVDAGTGQNALNQAQQFNEAVGLTGISLTKLDGTAKGGIIFAIAKRLGIPIRFIGVGESIEDLREFDAEQFVAALFDK
ncbi:MAG: signal recognition particle-docking protein FtsY [Gammaproteobacteria bacterium]|nr:signal recognition particle-docking protein FtsY [Gammaproteobacteria bacterium]